MSDIAQTLSMPDITLAAKKDMAPTQATRIPRGHGQTAAIHRSHARPARAGHAGAHPGGADGGRGRCPTWCARRSTGSCDAERRRSCSKLPGKSKIYAVLAAAKAHEGADD